jgi:hypothetical protein
LADAATQLFSPAFTVDGIPDMLKMLDQIAAEADTMVR